MNGREASGRKPRVIVDDPSNAKSVEYAGILGDAWELFERKSKDYTNSGGQVFEDSGLMGQFMKMRDKIAKLKKPMWDREVLRQAAAMAGRTDPRFTAETPHLNLEFEGAEEILMDLIGHSLLAISVLRERDRRDRQAQNLQQNPDGSFSYEDSGECSGRKEDAAGEMIYCRFAQGHPHRLCEGKNSKGQTFSWKRRLG